MHTYIHTYVLTCFVQTYICTYIHVHSPLKLFNNKTPSVRFLWKECCGAAWWQLRALCTEKLIRSSLAQSAYNALAKTCVGQSRCCAKVAWIVSCTHAPIIRLTILAFVVHWSILLACSPSPFTLNITSTCLQLKFKHSGCSVFGSLTTCPHAQ